MNVARNVEGFWKYCLVYRYGIQPEGQRAFSDSITILSNGMGELRMKDKTQTL